MVVGSGGDGLDEDEDEGLDEDEEYQTRARGGAKKGGKRGRKSGTFTDAPSMSEGSGEGVVVEGRHVLCASVPWGPEDLRWERVGSGPATTILGVVVATLAAVGLVGGGGVVTYLLGAARYGAEEAVGGLLLGASAVVVLAVDGLITHAVTVTIENVAKPHTESTRQRLTAIVGSVGVGVNHTLGLVLAYPRPYRWGRTDDLVPLVMVSGRGGGSRACSPHHQAHPLPFCPPLPYLSPLTHHTRPP